MTTASFIFILVCFIVAPTMGKASAIENETQCFTDRDCPETEFCFDSNRCIKCVDCTKINRYNSIKRCTKTLKDCGPCLSGFSEDSYLNVKRCSIIVAESQMAENRYVDSSRNSKYLMGSVFFLIILIVLTSYQVYRNRAAIAVARRSRLNTRYNTASPPPPYHNDECFSNSDNNSATLSFGLRITELAESKTTAIPFQLPVGNHLISVVPPDYENNSVEVNENVAVAVDESEVDSASNMHVDQDESTQPSEWTPGNAYLVTNVIDETDSSSKDEKEEKVDTPPTKKRKLDDEKSNDS